jgi:hypothetical protein
VYPRIEDAWHASNGLFVSSNETRYSQREQPITVLDRIFIENHGDPTGTEQLATITPKCFSRDWMRQLSTQ